MFDIIQSANMLFKSEYYSCKEIIKEFNCEYQIERKKLPKVEGFVSFLKHKPKADKIAITITSDTSTDSVVISDDNYNDWATKYNVFSENCMDDEKITVSIRITKAIKDGCISVYSLKQFSDFLGSLTIEQHFENFTKLFADCGEHISFQLLDTNGSLRTASISFSDNEVQWLGRRTRNEVLKECEDASVFLDRIKFRVVPQDFSVNVVEGSGFEIIKGVFASLRSVLSFIYIANIATVANGKAVLQFDPSVKGFEYELNQLKENTVMPLIFEWVFKDDSCVDKASIARKIINTYCQDWDSILTISEKVLNSIKTDYVIYQKNHADQYIEMKNRISEFIVESVRKIQEISHDITDAFRNNFVAVIVFLMTVLLTDSIDFSRLIEKEISSRLVAVCFVFTVSTILYFIVTLFMGAQKWEWLNQSYADLKENYDGVFDRKDLDESFNHDKPLRNAEKQYKMVRKRIVCAWITLIITLAVFTCFLMCQEKHFSTLKQTVVEVSESSGNSTS